MHPTAVFPLRGASLAAAFGFLLVSALSAAPVINEIMYHPPGLPEDEGQEWIEIHNPDPLEVDLGGCTLTQGADFTIPAGTVVPAGGFIVIAANVAKFQAAHPGFAGQLTGGWIGHLSNTGEAIRLRDTAGAELDTVDYSDEGDWAIRGRGAVVASWLGHQGWDWFTDADGSGKSKELVNPALRKNTGQIWNDSTPAGGTPGAINSVKAANVAPVILGTKHRPQIPRSTEAVTVSCKVTDDNAAAVTTTLRWRLDGAATFNSVAMTDADGDGESTATIPAQANLTVVEWYIQATDGALMRSWPPAARMSNPGVLPEVYAQSCNALYQVDNTYDASVPWTAGAQPEYRLILTAVERAELRSIDESDDNQNSQIDAAMNGTFIATDGTGQDTRYRCSVRNRGFSSRSGPPNNFSLSMVSGEEWAGRASFQLNCRYPYAAVCSAAIFTLGGMAVQEAAPAQFRVNGLNPATSGDGVGTFMQSITNGSLARIESLGTEWAASHFPNDRDGNLYRADDHNTGGSSASNRFAYPGSADPALYQDIYSKQTNADANDYADLAGLFQALNDSAATSAVFSANLRAKANVEQWLTYIALDSLVGNMEGGLTTGRSDDFSLYRGLTDQRFLFVPHDFDTTLGQNTPSGLTRTIFSHIDGSGGGGGGGIFTGLVRMFNEPEFLHIYYRKNVELCTSVFTNARLDPLFDELLSPWVPVATITAMKSFVTQRRTNVLNQIPQVNLFDATGVTTSNGTLIDGMKQTPDGAATFAGQFNVATVQSVRLNGQAASLQWRTTTNPVATAGRWTFAATAANGFLRKGTNRVNVVYYSGPGGTGDVIYSAVVDVFNSAAGTSVAANGTVSANQNSLFVKAPATYLPGIPFLVEVEYRDAAGSPDKFAWDRTATLTANSGVTLTPAGGAGTATFPLYNGRGSLLVQAGGGGTGTGSVLLRGRGSSGAGTVVTWNYYTVAATAPPAGWTAPAFVPTGWLSGAPVFYRGEVGLTGTNITTQSISQAFRTKFTVPNPSQYSTAKIRVQRDDGAIVYFNGNFLGLTPGMTQGMAWTAVCTTAITAVDEPSWIEFDVPVSQIIDGENTVAVEIHQANAGGGGAANGDMRFDLEMTGTLSGGGGGDPGNFTLTAAANSLTAAKAMTSLTLTPAMTNKSGALAGSETWSGVINVISDVTVPAGATLTISPGTHVLMAGTPFGGGGTGGADLIVQGALAANGTEASPISITCSNAANRWGEINFTSATASTMQHCLISRACHSPSGGHTATGPMIRLAGTTLTLEDSVVSDSPGKTLTNTGNATLTIRRSHLARSVMGPELDASALTLEDTHITDMLPVNRESGAADDEDCIYIHDSGGRPVNILRTVMANCGDDVLDCLGGSLTVTDTILRNGLDKGASLFSNNATIRRCLVVDNDIGLSAKISGGQEATAYTNTVENCTIVSQNHPANTGDGTFHSIGIHTRNKNNTASANIIWNVKNTIVSAEEPVANDYPTVGATVFGGMNFTYSCYQDLGGANPANATPAGTGDISVNPLFADAAGKNFRLQAASPCRDTGDPALLDADASRSDMGCYPYSTGGGVSPTNITWAVAGSPYLVAQNTTIAAGTTLTIDSGVSVFFTQNARLTVNGRLLALGTKDAHIRMSHVPGTTAAGDADPIKNLTQTGPPKWGGVRVVDSASAENIISYVDFLNAQGTSPAGAENYGSAGFVRSWGWADHLTFAGTHLRMCYGRNSRMTVTYCSFPDMFIQDAALGRVEIPGDFLAAADNNMEPLKVEYPTTDAELAGQTGANGTYPNGLPRDGHWRVYFNQFHGNRGHQDVFDADSGRWNVAGQFVLDCRYNTFNGLTGDEHIDLGGDAYIAHNRFYSGSKDQWTIDTGYANAISSGDKGSGTTIMVARNVFFDLDHAINCKINTATIFEHNTCVDFHQDWSFNHTVTQNVACSAVNLYVPNDGNAAGDGAYIAYNVFNGNSIAPDDTVSPDPIGGFPRLISWPDVTTTGAKTSVIRIENNFVDPAILDTSIGANHPGGIYATAWGFGNVQGQPLFTNKATKDFSLQPNSPAKGTATGGLDYGATIGEWVYILGTPPAQTASTGASLTIGGPGIVAYKWRLDGGAWSAPVQIGDGGLMSRTAPIVRQSILTFSNLGAGPHTVEVLGQDMAGNWQDADPARTIEGTPQYLPATATWIVNPALQLIRINEIASNTSNGNDWVELYNAGATAADAGGWTLAEKVDGSGGTVIPAGSLIAAGGYLVLDATTYGVGIDKDGDSLFLLAGAVVKDSITFGPQPLGYTLGRTGTAGGWQLCAPSAAAANTATGVSTSTSGLRITEVFAAGAISFKDDWVEICNTLTLPVELSGLRFSDNRAGTSGSVIPPYSYVGPNACAVFLADNTEPPAGNHLSFALDSQQDSVALTTGAGVVIDEILLFPQKDDWAQTRTASGGTAWAELPTRGFIMPATDPAYLSALAVLHGLRVTEIMYNASDGNDYDWIELRNTGATALNLNGVEFVDGIQFTFGNLTLAAGQNILLVANSGAFASHYGAGANIAGEYTGKLDNGGELLSFRLAPPFDANVLYFAYDDAWYPLTDGQGRSLELISTATSAGDYGDKNSWMASTQNGGTPDGRTIATVPTVYTPWLTFYATTDGADSDKDGLMSLDEFGLGLNPVQTTGIEGAGRAPTGVIGTDNRLAISFSLPSNASATGGYGRNEVTYRVEVSSDLQSPNWTTIATKTPAAGWTGTGTVVPGTATGGFVPLTIKDPATVPANRRRFIRLTTQWTP